MYNTEIGLEPGESMTVRCNHRLSVCVRVHDDGSISVSANDGSREADAVRLEFAKHGALCEVRRPRGDGPMPCVLNPPA